jgi:uncharacterized protein YjbI with pentapeptide repeats
MCPLDQVHYRFMADNEQLRVLKEGVDAWNALRAGDPFMIPELAGADLRDANLVGANFVGANLAGACFSGSNLAHASLNHADIRGANLVGAYLVDSWLCEANLTQSNLSHARLNRTVFTESRLRGTAFIRADVRGADFRSADLTGANFNGADLTITRFREAKLCKAIFTSANLIEADFGRADLTEADLTDAKLQGANFSSASLVGANFHAAKIGGTVFGNNDLRATLGLEALQHWGPSIIGIDTLFSSDGNIPESFLRDVGVPEDFITFIPSLVGRAIEFYSCFISYSHGDEEFSKRLHSRMRAENLRVWFAPEDMKGGRALHEQVFRAIQIYDKLLIVLSENSMKSEWVMTEIRRARKVEREDNRRKLFPIRLVNFEALKKWECFDADSGKDLALELRGFYIPDFSNWKDHDAFEAEFAKLLRSLKAEQPHPPVL